MTQFLVTFWLYFRCFALLSRTNGFQKLSIALLNRSSRRLPVNGLTTTFHAAAPNDRLAIRIDELNTGDENEKIQYYQRVDETLIQLQRHLPAILQTAVDTSTTIYNAKNFTLVGPRNEILASGIDELVSLSSALVATTTAANRFRKSVFTSFGTSFADKDSQLLLDCQIILSPRNNSIFFPIYVKWETEIPSFSMGSVMSASSREDASSINNDWNIQGLSEIILDEDDGRITRLRLIDLTVNNRTVIAVGETLAFLRQMTAPLLVRQQSLFTDIMRDALLMAAEENQYASTSDVAAIAQIYVGSDNSSSSILLSSNLVPIDNYSSVEGISLPGSVKFRNYVRIRNYMLEFCRSALPLLAYRNTVAASTEGSRDDELDTNDDAIRLFFAENTTLFGLDGKDIISNDRESILKLYKNLATLRYTTTGDFTIEKLMANWTTNSLTIQWKTTWPISVQGTDIFVFNPFLGGKVDMIKQTNWIVQGSPMRDAEWVRAFVRAVLSSNGDSAGEKIFTDLLKRAFDVAATTLRGSASTGEQRSPILEKIPPKGLLKHEPRELSSEAAISLYHIMLALHREIPLQVTRLSRKAGTETKMAIPAGKYLEEYIELQGLLNETIARGQVRLKQLFLTTMTSLRTLIQTGLIDIDIASPINIEFTQDSNLKIKLSLRVNFPILPTVPQSLKLPSSLLPKGSEEYTKLELVLLYKISNLGKIKEIRFLETRVNGRLTPADVVSKWIADATTGEEGSAPSALREIISNALAWTTRTQ